MAKIIELDHVDVLYGQFLAVEDVSLTIEPQTVTAFIGPSGCGKSTLLRTINRMHEVIPGARVKGDIRLDGVNLYGDEVDPVTVRRDVGMVFQRPNPFPTMSIRDNVLAGYKLNNDRVSKSDQDGIVESSLKSAHLWKEVKNRLDKPGGGLSGGQQQRLCIARAIAVRPRVLLMDEPTAGMAPSERAGLMALTAAIARERRIAVLFTEHDMDVVFGHADRILVLDRGMLIAEGPPAAVRADPRVREVYLGAGQVQGGH
jgi:phosphate transport system ATP-binding protein